MSRSKDVGTAAETALVRWLRDNGWPGAERRALRGTLDAGDVTGTPCLAWEVKAGQQAQEPGEGLLTTWMDETEAERRNARADVGVLVLRRRGKGNPGDWWAYLPLGALVALAGVGVKSTSNAPVRLRLADLVDELHRAGYGEADVAAIGPVHAITKGRARLAAGQ
jgi:hypothetical protein